MVNYIIDKDNAYPRTACTYFKILIENNNNFQNYFESSIRYLGNFAIIHFEILVELFGQLKSSSKRNTSTVVINTLHFYNFEIRNIH